MTAPTLSTAHPPEDRDHAPRVRAARRPARWRTALTLICLLAATACSAGRSSAQGAPPPDWAVADIPAQDGRVVVVTGGTSGIGFETAKALAAAGAQVVIAARNAERGAEAVAAIRGDTPDAVVRFESLDLSDLASVRGFARRLDASLPRIDVLVNNAGIMEPPRRGESADGYEMQFATNYLGHFALTAELLPLLRKAPSPRVVNLSSIAARRGEIQFDDPQFVRDYDPGDAYQQSKLASLMFALELQRRSDAAGWGIRSIASHPGVSRTNLQANNGVVRQLLGHLLLQPAARGALPTLYAAAAPDARGGHYYGPTGVMELRGPLGLARVPAAATDDAASERLWDMSETLAGVRFADAVR